MIQPQRIEPTLTQSFVFTILEQQLKRKVLNIACHYYVHDLILEKVFTSVLQDMSKWPNIFSFSFFSEKLSKYSTKSKIINKEVAKKIIEWKDEIITFAERSIQESY